MRVYLLLNACSTNPFASICQGISNVFLFIFSFVAYNPLKLVTL